MTFFQNKQPIRLRSRSSLSDEVVRPQSRTAGQAGFTMLQLIIVVAIILVLSAAVFTWIDPVAKIGETKNNKRTQDINIIATAIAEYSGDHKGVLPVIGEVATSTKKVLCSSQSGSTLDCDGDSAIRLKVDDPDFYKYLSEFPYDPDKDSSEDTGYYLFKDSNGQLEVGACDTYDNESISRTLSIKVTCPAYAGGECWYVSYDRVGDDCDDVCAEYNLTCVNNAVYGPDVDSEETGFCALNQAFGYMGELRCASGCSSSDSSSGPPANQNGASACYYRTHPVVCSGSTSGFFSVCPCE